MTTQTTRIYALETSMRMFGAIAAGAVQCQQPSPASALIFSLSIRQLNRLKCHDMRMDCMVIGITKGLAFTRIII
ncbi:unnamed protein product [Rhizophagus irregularis]|nr:unnamed protein product [Rhizophagus irregularis]